MSAFSSVTQVASAFRSMFMAVSNLGKPLILSYPPDGLLSRRAIDPAELAGEYFTTVDTQSFRASHSTMGASNGKSKHEKVENIYVCGV